MATAALSNGSTVWYEKLGSGPTLFQIHGSAFGHKNFERLTPLLVDDLGVIDFDLPGFGASGSAPHGGGIHNWADDVADLIRALGYERAHIHGTSLGGLIGLSLAARHQDVVDRVILSCFMPRYDQAARVMRSTWMDAARHIGMAAVADLTAVAGFSRQFFEQPDAQSELERMRVAFSGNDPNAFLGAAASLMDLDLSALADDVKSPLLLIGADEDNMTPVDPAPSGFGLRQLNDRILGSELVVISECGHYMVIEKPEETARCIIEFVSRA